MSAALQSSLTKLNRAVEKLESAVETKTDAAKSNGQNDLFGGITTKASRSNDNLVDTAALADKLDSAILKVEKMLQEG